MKLSFVFLIIIIVTITNAQTLYEKQIIPFDAMSNDWFGQGVAINDSLLFISSLRYSNTIEGCVYVYKFKNSDYVFETKIYPDDPEALALFGSRLLYQDGQLFVGTQNKKVNGFTVGALYVFEYANSNWVQIQKIVPPEPLISQKLFSNAIAKLNETLVVSAFRSDAGAEDAGKVFIYKYIDNEYILQQELEPYDAKDYQYFGTSLLIKKNLLIVGSELDSTSSGFESGSIYTYVKEDSVWVFARKYIPEPNSQNLTLGASIASNENFVFVGSSDSYYYNEPGKVYIYKNTVPLLDLYQIIETGDGYFDDSFGSVVQAKGDTLLVTALSDTVNSSYPGSVYMFVNRNDTWIRKSKIVPSDEPVASWFGCSLAINDQMIFIGAKLSGTISLHPGKVYLFSKTPLSVFDEEPNLVDEFFVYQNFPNPFNSNTRIEYYLPSNGDIVIEIINNLGQRIISRQILNQSEGHHYLDINLNGYSSGVYFIKVNYAYEVQNKVINSTFIKKAAYIK